MALRPPARSPIVAALATPSPTGRRAGDQAHREQPEIAPTTVLVVSRDATQRQNLVLALNACDALTVSSAAGFHMAVPMLWGGAVDVVVVGALAPHDLARLPELRHHAREAALLVMGGVGSEYAAARPEAAGLDEAELFAVMSRLRPMRG